MFGVSSDMLRVLDLSADRFDSMAGQAFLISPEAIKSLTKTKAALDHAGRGIKWLKSQIAVALAPQIRKLTRDIVKFITANKQGFIDGFKKAFTFVSRFVSAISTAAREIDTFIQKSIGWKNTIIMLGVALGAAMLTSPLGAIIAGFTLLFLLIEDIAAYNSGKLSLFGEFEKGFPKIANGIKVVIEKIDEAFKLVLAIVKGDAFSIQSILDDWGFLGKVISFALDKLKGAYTIVKKVFNFLKNIGQGLHPKTGEKDKDGNPLIDEEVENSPQNVSDRRLQNEGDYNWQTGQFTNADGSYSFNDPLNRSSVITTQNINTNSHNNTSIVVETLVANEPVEFLDGIAAQIGSS